MPKPVPHVDINDDEEFTSCNVCKSSVQRYNNTSLSTAPIHTIYTKTLLQYHHLNCQKCGLYIEIHPKHTADEGLIFVCSDSIPHRHCLCYECGLLYDLNADDKKSSIINQLQYNHTTQSTNPVLEPKTTTSNVLDASNGLTNVGIVSNGTFIAEVMHEMVSTTTKTEDHGSATQDGLTLLIGTVMALFVWLGIYWSSPELFRLTGCFVWFSIFYFLISLCFTENESIQRAVFSLFGFSPIVASIYLLERTRRYPDAWQQDVSTSLQFLCVFGCIAYFACYWSPLEMYLFLVNDFFVLSFMEQGVSLFIALSMASFIVILCGNCGVSVDGMDVWWSGRKHHDEVSVFVDRMSDVSNEFESLKLHTDEEEEEEVIQECHTLECAEHVNVTKMETPPTKKKRKRRRKKRKKKKVAVECH
eukprot:236611_1